MKRKWIINKKYRLKHAIKVIAISLISLSPLICFIFILMNTSQNVDVTEKAARAEEAVVTQENIIKSFMDYSKRVKNDDIMVVVDMVNKDHAQSIAALKESLGLLQDMAQREREMLLIAVLIMIAHVVLLSVFFINNTGNIFGNIFLVPHDSKYHMNRKEPSEKRLWCDDDECNR